MMKLAISPTSHRRPAALLIGCLLNLWAAAGVAASPAEPGSLLPRAELPANVSLRGVNSERVEESKGAALDSADTFDPTVRPMATDPADRRSLNDLSPHEISGLGYGDETAFDQPAVAEAAQVHLASSAALRR